ncbi:Ribose ABC transport system, permease protein RbsC (TC 3.A.1.2.1) [Olavius sp. associated proteobacterium Delta 1]|nr:Ribose ABC transport system, permease protein RbsC (TC 3.A.1.2.1) [Olavius sp. associated proteobacterium Delta 1]
MTGKPKISKSDNLTLFVIMIATIGVMSIFLPDKFLRLVNFQSMASQFPEYGLLALGIMLAMITGGIDLSVVSIANLSGVVGAMVLASHVAAQGIGISPGTIIFLAIIAALAVSLICGLINGLIITAVEVPAIIATLGTNGLFMGTAIILTEGHGIRGFPDEFLFIGSGEVLAIPMPLIIFIVVACLVSLMLKKSSQGFKMYMLGSSPLVSKFSGINNNMVLIKTYLLSGLLAGTAAIIIISRVNSMRPGYGYAYLLLGVLIAILGGTNPEGGRGGVLGMCMAIVILQVLQSGLNILGFNPFYKKFIWGLILILVMVINFYQKNGWPWKNLIRKNLQSGAS